jgi:superoxide reductase
MTQIKQIYKCSVCGNIVEVVHDGVGQLVCCGQPMDLQEEKTEDAGKEKHVPVIEKKEHFIEWIELNTDGVIRRKTLKPGDKPEAEFCVCNAKELSARIYCNVHGLWKSI